MSMALALAKAIESDTIQPKEESVMEIPISEKLAKKINVASGEDAGFVLDPDDAWEWHKYESNLKLGNPNAL